MSSESIIKLNIGGTIFQTTKSTLTKYRGYFKTRLESGIPLVNDETGAIFVDRSPKHFERILNFMRDGEVGLPGNTEELKEIRKEAQYYLLEDLIMLCDAHKELIPRNNNHFLETMGEVVNAILNSTKKAVILIPYHPENNQEPNRAVMITSELQKYVVDFDVHFVSSKAGIMPCCRIRDNTTGKVSCIAWPDFDKFMKDHYGI